jgi:hypothetical protein
MATEGSTPNLTITSPGNGDSVGNSVTINWTGGKPGYNANVSGPSVSCSKTNTTDTSLQCSGFKAVGNYTATVTDSAGKTSTVTFHR